MTQTSPASPVEVQPKPWPGAGGVLNSIPEGWHSPGQAGKIIGRSKETLKRWMKDGTFTPSGYMLCGKLKVHLYSNEDIDELRDIAGNKKSGRPPYKEEEEHAAGS